MSRDAAAQAPAATDWPLVWGLFLAGLLAAGQFAKISLSLPDVAAVYGRPVPSVAWLVSILGVIGIAGGVLAGSVVAALGARRVLLACLALGGALSLTEALLPPLWVLGGLRIAEGISHLGLVVAAPPLMAASASRGDRPMVMAIWAAFFGVAFAIGAVIVPPTLGAGGLPLLLAGHGALMLLMALVLAPRLAPQAQAPLRLSPVAVHREIYADPCLFAPGLGFVFYTLIFVAMVTLLPLALGAPWLAVALPIVGLCGTFAAGPLLGRRAPWQVAALGFGATVLLAVPLFLGVVWPLIPLFFLLGMVPSASFAMIPHLNHSAPDRARATGCIAQLGNVGTTCGTPAFAVLLVAGGLPALYAALALVAACGLAVTLALRGFARAS